MWERAEIYRIVIIYYSRSGVLEALAEAIAEGARRVEGAETHFIIVPDQPVEELRSAESEQEMLFRRAALVNQMMAADAMVVGAPAYFGSMASPVKRLFEDCVTLARSPEFDRSHPRRAHAFRDKVGAAFTSSATPHGGNEQALHSILTMQMHLGMVVVTPGLREPILEDVSAPYGATAISGPTGCGRPTDEELAAARDLGQRVAEVTTWLVTGRWDWWKRRDTQERAAFFGTLDHPVGAPGIDDGGTAGGAPPASPDA
jgi:NAD(P)H dehydrogenase (quinone)